MRSIRRWGEVFAPLAGGMAILGLWSWVAGVSELLTPNPDQLPMAPGAAVCLALLSGAVWLHYRSNDRPIVRRVIGVILGVNIAAGGLAALRWWLDWGSPFEEWLSQTTARVNGVPTGQMSPATGGMLVMLAAGLGLLRSRRGRAGTRVRGARGLATVVAAGAAGVIGSYLLGRPWLAGGAAIPVAFWTAVVVMILAGSVLGAPMRVRSETVADRGRGGVSPFREWRRRPSGGPLAISILAALLISAIGALHLRREQTKVRLEERHRLATIGEVKVQEIARWREDRQNDGRFLARAGFVARDVKECLGRPAGEAAGGALLGWFRLLIDSGRYTWAGLVDTELEVRAAVPEQRAFSKDWLRPLVEQAARDRDVVLSDLHRCETGGEIHQDLIIPVFEPTGVGSTEGDSAGGLVGWVVVRLTPREVLYPMIQSWPTRSATAERVLFRREGSDFLVLNELRHRSGTALELRLPTAGHKVSPAVLASPEGDRQAEGWDYRGHAVLADIRPVPGTSWFLMAKVDREEIYAPLRRQAWMVLSLTAVLAIASGLAAGLVWKHRVAARAREELAAERERLVLARRLEHLMRNASDAIILADEDDTILEANERMQEMHGYSLAEFQGMKFSALRAARSEGADAGPEAGRAATVLDHRRKDGSTFPVEVSLTAVEIGGRRLQFGILRDITQRRDHEREIERLNGLYATLSEINQAIVRCQSRDELFHEVCRIAASHGGFRLAWLGWLDRATGAVRPVARAGEARGYPERVCAAGMVGVNATEPALACLRSGEPQVVALAGADSGEVEWRREAEAMGLRAAAAIPIRYQGEVVGALAVYAPEAGVFRDQEKALLGEIAFDLSFALENFDREEQRRRNESELRGLSDRLMLATRAAQVGIWDADLLGGRLIWDDAMCRLYGMTPGQFEGTLAAWIDALHPEDRARASEEIELAFEGRKDFNTEFRVPWSDGSIHYIRAIGIVQRSSAGRPIRMLGTNWDISDLKRAEEALWERFELQNQLAKTAATVPGMIYSFRLRPDGTMSMPYASSALERILGLSPEEVRDDAGPVLGMIHPDDRERVRDSILQSAQTMTPWRLEFRACNTRWGEIWISGESMPQLEADGSVLWHGFLQDVTTRKQSELQLRKLSRAVEQSPVSIVITDTHGNIEYVNPQFTALTGYELDEVRGQNPRVLKAGDQAPVVYRDLWNTIARGEVWRGEFHNRKKNGESFWESASISPVVDEGGRITHFVAVKEDITERKRLEAQFRQSQKMEAVGQLAGGVAHDFNNILAVILMHLGLMRQHPGLDDELRESVADLESQAKRAAALTRQLLMFSRRSVMEVRSLQINEVVEDLLKMLRRLIGEHIELEWRGQARLPRVDGDAGMLEQVLMNLVVNARDAMPKGGRLSLATDEVRWTGEQVRENPDARAGHFVRLTVADTGCGMSESVLKRVFEPFYTTKEAGKGSGLGLATVYGIVQQHEGWVTVESEVGRGSTFRVFLPVARGVGAERELPEFVDPPKGREESILLVEDDAPLRRALGQVLRRLGYRVVEAGNGREAMAAWERNPTPPDLLLTDMVMPESMNGLELAHQLRSACPDLKVIISSGYSADLVEQGGLSAEGFRYLPKPCPPPELAAAVRRCLDGD